MLTTKNDPPLVEELEMGLLGQEPAPQLDVLFRPAVAEDWEQLCRHCYPTHEATLLRIHFERALEQQKRNRGQWLIAAVEGVIVGAGQLSPYGSRLEIANVAVDARWRRRGIGGAIVTRLNRQAGAMGYGSVDISVAANNAGALRLYRRLGFEHCHYIRQGSMPAIVVLRAGTEAPLVV